MALTSSRDRPAEPATAVILGASGGVGRALLDQVLAQGRFSRVLALSRTRPSGDLGEAEWAPVDYAAETSLEQAAGDARQGPPVRLVLVATGALQALGRPPEKSMRNLDPETLLEAFRINTIGPALAAKHFLPLLPRQGRSVFAALSARVGSIGDNRLGGWHGYRASKAALNMMIRSLSIELARTHPQAICVTLHPGTVDTQLSRPFQKGLPADQVITPERSAERLLAVLDGLTPAETGAFFDWRGQPISW